MRSFLLIGRFRREKVVALIDGYPCGTEIVPIREHPLSLQLCTGFAWFELLNHVFDRLVEQVHVRVDEIRVPGLKYGEALSLGQIALDTMPELQCFASL